MRGGDEARLGLVDGRMLARIVADIPPGDDAAEHGAEPGQREGDAPRIEFSDQPGDDQRAERGAERRAAIEQGWAGRALIGRHPYRVELAAGRIDRRFGGAEPESGYDETEPIGRKRGETLEQAPAQRRRGDDEARFEAVGEQAARNLHQGVSDEEDAQ